MENTLLDKLNEWAGTIDLDYTHKKFGIAYCFEYIVPKLSDINHQYLITLNNVRDGWKVQLFSCLEMADRAKRVDEIAKTEALALCRAVEKLIDE